MKYNNTESNKKTGSINAVPEISQNYGGDQNVKENKMNKFNDNFVIFDKEKLPNLSEIVLEYISNIITDEGIDFISFDNICLILERSPEHVTIESCECCGSVHLNASIEVHNPSGLSQKYIEEVLGVIGNDEWCEVSYFPDKNENTISYRMVVGCEGFELINFPKKLANFDRKLKTLLEAASELGLEIALDDDADPLADSE